MAKQHPLSSRTLRRMNDLSSRTPISTAQKKFTLGGDSLHNRNVLITGATGGLGTALSKACAAAGATVILAGRNLKKLETLYDAIDAMNKAQPAIVTINQESTNESEYHGVADMLEKEFGHIDALIHTTAELGTLTPLHAIDQAEWSRIMVVNVSSARLLTNACLPLLNESKHASIVFTLDTKLSAYWGTYGVSKAALSSLCRMLADETEGRTDEQKNPVLAVNGIDPGPMRTPLRRRAFPGEVESESPLPEDCLGPFLWLISRHDRNLTGVNLSLQ